MGEGEVPLGAREREVKWSPVGIGAAPRKDRIGSTGYYVQPGNKKKNMNIAREYFEPRRLPSTMYLR